MLLHGKKEFKMATGEPIKHFREIQRLLTTIYCPKGVSVTHFKGYSRDGSKVAEGNQLADCQVRKVALYETPSLQTPLIWTGPVEQEKSQYTEEELERYEKRGAKITDKGWLQSEDGLLIIPENAQWKILKGLHQSFHLGAESTYQMASRLFEGKNVMKTLKNIIKRCGKYPGEDWKIDFTHMPKANGYSCLQVWVGTFTGWIEAFPCHRLNRLRRL